MSDKNFKVKNGLIINGNAGSAGVLTIDSSNTVATTSYLPTQYGGTGTSVSPSSGQFLYSASGTNYSPTSTSVLYPTQTGNAGKYLSTDGSGNLSWASAPQGNSYIIDYIDNGLSNSIADIIYDAGANGGSTSSWNYTIDAGASVVSF